MRSKKTTLTVILAFLTLSIFSQTTFRFSYDLGAFDITGGMVQTPAKEFVIAGLNNSFGPYYGDAMKIDSAGNVIWAKAYTAGFATNFADIKTVSTGGYIVTGSSTSGGGGALLVRLDAAGAVLWAFRYQLPNFSAPKASNEFGSAVIETSDGGFLVGGGVDYFWDGSSANTVDTTSAMGFKVNSAGTLLWSKVWTITTANPDEHYVNDVAESADGYFFVGESSEGSGTLNSDGDYPRNSLVIKTDFAGTLTYIRRWGAGNATSQGINSALRLSTGNILLGGYDDVHAFIVSISGTGSGTPTVIFNRRLNGSAFGNIYLIQDIMENSDGNYSMIGTQFGFFTVTLNTMIGKINSTSTNWMFGRTYAPIGLSAILPEGGLCTDQGYYVSMTDQQMGGFNFNVIRTDPAGLTNDPASGCNGTAVTPPLGTESITWTTPTSSNYNLMTSSSFAPTVNNLSPTRVQHCLNAPAALSSTGSSSNINCNGQCTGSASVTASGGSGAYTYTWSPSGGNAATASGLCPNTYTCTISDGTNTSVETFTITQPATALASSPSQGTITCAGGTTTATVTPSGGTGGYAYTWSPSGGNAATASGLGAGNYTASVTDANGCLSTSTYTITAPPAISPTITATPATCGSPNGSATVSATGGTGVLTYSWNTGATGQVLSGVSSGSYTAITTDGNGCTVSTPVTISNSGGPTATAAESVSVTCNGSSTGTATVNISGGTPGYTVTSGSGSVSGTTISNLPAGTHTFTVTDAGGCLTTATVTISQPAAALTSTPSQGTITCAGGTTTATVTPSGGTGAYTYTWSPSGGNSATASGLSGGNYTATVTDANGCTTASTYTITDPPAISATITATPPTCGSANGSATVSATGGSGVLTYSWNTGATGPVLSGLSGGSYTAVTTDGNGCTVSTPVTINSNGAPSATAAESASVTCSGASNGTATLNISGGTPNYTVTSGSGSVSGTTVSNLPGGTYTFTITDAGSCVTTATVTINEPPAIVVTFTDNSPSACAIATGSVTANATGGTGVLTYSWSTGTSGQTLSNVPAGSYTVTVTDANSCSQAGQVTIGSVNGPTVTPAVTASVTCNGASTGSASVNISGGVPGYTVTWSGGGSGTTVSGQPGGTQTITVTDAGGCIATETVTISEPTAVTSTVTGSQTGCASATGSATVTAAGGTPTYTYTWSNSQTGTTATGLSQGVYTVTITDANNCSVTNTVSIGVTNAPIAAVDSTDDVLCNGQTNGVAYASATGGTPGYTYNWSSGQSGASVTGLGQGSYTVVVTDLNGCKDSTTVTINAPAVLGSSVSSVLPENCNLQNGSATAAGTGGTPGYTYQWTSGQGTATVNNFPAGTYSVVITDANGCTDTNSVTITNVPGPTLTLSGQNDITCNGAANGTATVIATGGTPSYTYTWSNGGTGATNSGMNSGSFTATVTDSAGCTSSTTLTISEPGAIQINTSSTLVNCSGGNDGTASATVSGGTSPYAITWSNSQTGTLATGLSTGIYTVTVLDNNSCPATNTVLVGENPPLDTMSFTGNMCVNDETILLQAPLGGGITNYQWYLSGTAIPGATGSTYTGSVALLSNYAVTWFKNGCRFITYSNYIVVNQDMGVLPQTNVFSPNGDKINDDFLPFNTSNLGTPAAADTLLDANIENYELTIYDRWGVLMFSSTKVLNKWDGKTINGKDCPDATYYWFAKFKAKCSRITTEQTLKGFVQLIR